MAKTKGLPLPPRTDLDALVDAWGAHVEHDLLQLALTHRSYANEAGGLPNNERLEFLGDAVLSIVVADYVFRHYPESAESELSRMRAATVSQVPLAQAARRFDLGSFIHLGKGEDSSGGRDKDSILSDTFEALVGATYLTCGLEPTRAVVLERLGFLLAKAASKDSLHDWKSKLVERVKELHLGDVIYDIDAAGPDHQRVFTARVSATGVNKVLGSGTGTSKKHAENIAAQAAVRTLDLEFSHE